VPPLIITRAVHAEIEVLGVVDIGVAARPNMSSAYSTTLYGVVRECQKVGRACDA
jgi:hypothetical protein